MYRIISFIGYICLLLCSISAVYADQHTNDTLTAQQQEIALLLDSEERLEINALKLLRSVDLQVERGIYITEYVGSQRIIPATAVSELQQTLLDMEALQLALNSEINGSDSITAQEYLTFKQLSTLLSESFRTTLHDALDSATTLKRMGPSIDQSMGRYKSQSNTTYHNASRDISRLARSYNAKQVEELADTLDITIEQNLIVQIENGAIGYQGLVAAVNKQLNALSAAEKERLLAQYTNYTKQRYLTHQNEVNALQGHLNSVNETTLNTRRQEWKDRFPERLFNISISGPATTPPRGSNNLEGGDGDRTSGGDSIPTPGGNPRNSGSGDNNLDTSSPSEEETEFPEGSVPSDVPQPSSPDNGEVNEVDEEDLEPRDPAERSPGILS